MRLREIGPGIGGLYYDPLLRNRNEQAVRRALARLPLGEAGPASIGQFWLSIRSTALTMGRRIVASRQAQAKRLIACETARLFPAEAQRIGRSVVGARYY